ncbi:YfaP family protein [Sediminicola luteus]|uniref:TonB-dependent receptor plug domain-containing protein n=1 Tax=Sediminicola luteus TaxID=319238 RepID=A0A2A4G5F3_9FLAO|nr:hypothetical protein [Sediminicola luteus]PCE63663.1 hypothetical protein B7P33_10280 [Sediminicola luteus]
MRNLIQHFVLICFTLSTLTVIGQKESPQTRTIKGKVTLMEVVEPYAEIGNTRTDIVTKPNKDGSYEIKAKTGDILVFSAPNGLTQEIIVEDVTRYLNIDLKPKYNELDNVTVESSKRKKNLQLELLKQYQTDKGIIKSAFGFIHKDRSGYAMYMTDDSQFSAAEFDLLTIINGRFPGMRTVRDPYNILNAQVFMRSTGRLAPDPAIWDVDGMIFTEYPSWVNPLTVKRVAALPGFGAVGSYGSIARGGVIIVNTENLVLNVNPYTGKKDLAYATDNYVQEKSVNFNHLKRELPTYLKPLESASSLHEAQKIYSVEAKKNRGNPFFAIDAYQYFEMRWGSTFVWKEILKENHPLLNHPVHLKAISFLAESFHRDSLALALNQRVFKLRPKYIQSYISLAQAHFNNEDRDRGMALLGQLRYLEANESLPNFNDGLNEPIRNQILFENGPNQKTKPQIAQIHNITESLGPGTARLNFEWNDSEAEFEIQFVNPRGQFVNWEHSLNANPDIIEQEKKLGYSSKDFILEDFLDGQWQVNIKYLGNKSATPSYMRLTYDQGNNESKTVVFKLEGKSVKRENVLLIDPYRGIVTN